MTLSRRVQCHVYSLKEDHWKQEQVCILQTAERENTASQSLRMPRNYSSSVLKTHFWMGQNSLSRGPMSTTLQRWSTNTSQECPVACTILSGSLRLCLRVGLVGMAHSKRNVESPHLIRAAPTTHHTTSHDITRHHMAYSTGFMRMNGTLYLIHLCI